MQKDIANQDLQWQPYVCLGWDVSPSPSPFSLSCLPQPSSVPVACLFLCENFSLVWTVVMSTPLGRGCSFPVVWCVWVFSSVLAYWLILLTLTNSRGRGESYLSSDSGVLLIGVLVLIWTYKWEQSKNNFWSVCVWINPCTLPGLPNRKLIHSSGFTDATGRMLISNLCFLQPKVEKILLYLSITAQISFLVYITIWFFHRNFQKLSATKIK